MADIKIIVDSSDVVEAANDVKRLDGSVGSVGRTSKQTGKSISDTTRGMNQFGSVSKMGGKKLNTFNMQIQQGGYQLQDFAVQLQSGTSVFTAFGQQGSQFAGVFGPQGAVIGAVIAIGSAVGGMAYKMLTSGDEVREFQKILEDTTDILGELADANKAATMSNKELEESFGTASVQIKSTLALLRSIAQNESQRAIDDLSASLVDLYSVSGDGERRGGIAKLFDVNIMYALSKAAKVARKEARILTAEFVNAQDALAASEGNIEGQIEATQRLLNVAVTLANVNGSISEEEESLIKKLSESLLVMQETQTVKDQVLSTYEDILGTEESLADSTAALNELFEARLGTIDDTANLYEDILGSSKGLEQATQALNVEHQNTITALTTQLALSQAIADTYGTGMFGEFGNAPTRQGTVDDFGGYGDFKYGDESTFTPESFNKKKKKSGGGKDPREQLAEYLVGKQQELELETKLAGIFGTEREIKSELISVEQKYGDLVDTTQTSQLAGTLRQIEAEKERQAALEEAATQQQQLADLIGNSMEKSMMGIVDGTMSVKDAFKSMAADVIKELYRVLVVQQMVNAAKGFFGFADGGAFSGGTEVKAYADGGVVNGPTTFPMSGGKTGLMGEAGPEAIMPLKRGSNGKLGVQAEGGGGDTIVVHQNFNFQSNGDDSIKKLIAQAAPQISAMTKSSLLNDRRRGGATKAAFG